MSLGLHFIPLHSTRTKTLLVANPENRQVDAAHPQVDSRCVLIVPP